MKKFNADWLAEQAIMLTRKGRTHFCWSQKELHPFPGNQPTRWLVGIRKGPLRNVTYKIFRAFPHGLPNWRNAARLELLAEFDVGGFTRIQRFGYTTYGRAWRAYHPQAEAATERKLVLTGPSEEACVASLHGRRFVFYTSVARPSSADVLRVIRNLEQEGYTIRRKSANAGGISSSTAAS